MNKDLVYDKNIKEVRTSPPQALFINKYPKIIFPETSSSYEDIRGRWWWVVVGGGRWWTNILLVLSTTERPGAVSPQTGMLITCNAKYIYSYLRQMLSKGSFFKQG